MRSGYSVSDKYCLLCMIEVCLQKGGCGATFPDFSFCQHAFLMRVKARKRFDLVVEVSVQRRFY